MEGAHVLVVHSDSAVGRLAVECFATGPIHVSIARTKEDGLSVLERRRVHVLVTGGDLGDDGDEFLRKAATIQPLIGVLLVPDPARPDYARRLAPSEAIQCLERPVTREGLQAAVEKAVRRQRIGGPAPGLPVPSASPSAGNGAASPPWLGRIVAESRSMRAILEMIGKCAPTDMPVLLRGEPDTGKELVAREIHRQSRRASGPFVRVACGALPEPELGECLFGRCEQAVSLADHTAAGLVEKAGGGTLFVDNISLLPPWAQLKLLDVLEQGESERAAGGDRAGGVRVIASTTADLAQLASQQPLLARLHYYFNVVQICIPPLRQRPQDIPLLAAVHLGIANAMRTTQGRKRPCRLTDDGVRCLVEYDWPGNILQLASVMAHVVLLADGDEIGRAQIAAVLGAAAPRGPSESISVPLAGGLKGIERAVIQAVIERCRGNKAAAARTLKLHRRTLYRILDEEASQPQPPAALPLVLGPTVADSAAGALS